MTNYAHNPLPTSEKGFLLLEYVLWLWLVASFLPLIFQLFLTLSCLTQSWLDAYLIRSELDLMYPIVHQDSLSATLSSTGDQDLLFTTSVSSIRYDTLTTRLRRSSTQTHYLTDFITNIHVSLHDTLPDCLWIQAPPLAAIPICKPVL